MKKFAFLLAAALLCGGSSRALDADDVRQLLQNGVNETVILNMVQARPLARPLSAQEVVSLQASGASSSLLAGLTSPGSAAAGYASPQAAAPVYAAPVPAPVILQPPVITQPSVVYAAPSYCPPTYVVPRRAPPRITFSFGFGHSRDRGYRYYGRPSFRRYGGWSGRRWRR